MYQYIKHQHINKVNLEKIQDMSMREIRDLIAAAGDLTVDKIAQARQREHAERDPAQRGVIGAEDEKNHEYGDEHHAHERDLAGCCHLSVSSMSPMSSPSQVSVTVTVTNCPGSTSRSDENQILPSISGESAYVLPKYASFSSS